MTDTNPHANDCPNLNREEDGSWEEHGFGLAGGGYGPYTFCPVCGAILDKVQVDD